MKRIRIRKGSELTRKANVISMRNEGQTTYAVAKDDEGRMWKVARVANNSIFFKIVAEVK